MRKQIFSAVFGALALSVAANADVIATTGASGQTPDSLSISGLTLLASETVSLNSLTFTGTLNAAVFSGNNIFCPANNCLTFAYQVTDTAAAGAGTGVIETLTASSFGGLLTDIGDETLSSAFIGFTAGGVAPYTVGRSAAGNGSVIDFDYPDPPVVLGPGTTTNLLIIQTNAVSYAVGLFSAQDGATVTDSAYEPVLAGSIQPSTPEPSSILLMGPALIGLGFLLKRTRRQA